MRLGSSGEIIEHCIETAGSQEVYISFKTLRKHPLFQKGHVSLSLLVG
jgi:hypothetical protein